MSYISAIEKECGKYRVEDLCSKWKRCHNLEYYLAVASLWEHDIDATQELVWLSQIHQAGRNQ